MISWAFFLLKCQVNLHGVSPAFVACSWQTGQQGVLSPPGVGRGRGGGGVGDDPTLPPLSSPPPVVFPPSWPNSPSDNRHLQLNTASTRWQWKYNPIDTDRIGSFANIEIALSWQCGSTCPLRFCRPVSTTRARSPEQNRGAQLFVLFRWHFFCAF